jgi:hypothetical protein
MKNRYIHFNADGIKPINFCGETIMWEVTVDGGYEVPYEIEPIIGEHDFNICETCQKVLTVTTKQLTDRFNGNAKAAGFPYCCQWHSNLVNVQAFNRDSFVEVPKMTAKKIVYTHQHIINNLFNDMYYKEITDYIEYVVESFGKVPNGCGERLYLNYYLHWTIDLTKKMVIEKSKISLAKERIEKILQYLNAYLTPVENTQTDMQLLVGTYEKWFKMFFELTFFAHLKEHYQSQLPILNGVPETNRYTGLSKAKLHTKSTLIEALVDLTNGLLIKINSHSLYEKGLLTDPQKIKLELILNERKAKLQQGYKNNSQDEGTRYRKMLKEWFKDEKKFIDDITPLLQNPTKPNIEKQSPELTFADLFISSDTMQTAIELARKAGLEHITERAKYKVVVFWEFLKTNKLVKDVDGQKACGAVATHFNVSGGIRKNLWTEYNRPRDYTKGQKVFWDKLTAL